MLCGHPAFLQLLSLVVDSLQCTLILGNGITRPRARARLTLLSRAKFRRVAIENVVEIGADESAHSPKRLLPPATLKLWPGPCRLAVASNNDAGHIQLTWKKGGS